jgi:hypothetical protein
MKLIHLFASKLKHPARRGRVSLTEPTRKDAMTTPQTGSPQHRALRTPGFWLAVPLAVLQAINVGRALSDPSGFADYFGAPVSDSGAIAWVQVYALRTAFITGLVSVFLLRRDLRALFWTAAVATIMPLGDAWIAYSAGAPQDTLLRHLLIGIYVVVTCIALAFASRRVGTAS